MGRFDQQLRRLALSARNALELARMGRLSEPYQARFEVLYHTPMMRLRRYTPSHPQPLGQPDAPPILLVPPLMVTSEVYDIAEDLSAVRYLLSRGIDVWLCDFGAPETEDGGLERTLDDHVRAVDEAIDQVRALTQRGGALRDVHLAGYSQGGMFCYQVAAYRRSQGLGSVITFGSPVDIHRNVPAVGDGPAGALIAGLESLIRQPLEKLDALPGNFSSLAFKLVSLRKEVGQITDFVTKLHDRQALEKRESRRRFLAGEGFVAWPGPAFRKFVDDFIVHNRMLSGGFVIDGRTVTLADIRCPILCFVGEKDDIARPAAVQAIQRAAIEAEIHEVPIPAGHFGLVVGSKAMSQTWPTTAEFIHWREAIAANEADGGLSGEDAAVIPAALKRKFEIKPSSLEDPDADFGEVDFDLNLFVDGISSAAKAIWRQIGQSVEDTAQTAHNLRYQLPRFTELESLSAEAEVSLAKRLDEQARRAPEATFFLWRSRAFSYAEANRRVDAVSAGLLSVGVRKGEVVAILMHARPSLLTSVAALNRIGAVAAVLPPDWSPEALRACLERSGASRIVVDPERSGIASAISELPCYVLGGGREREATLHGAIDMEQIDLESIKRPPGFEANTGRARDLAMIFFTASSAGVPRVSRITNHRWMVSALGVAGACTLSEEDTVYAALPLHHLSGMVVAVGGALVGRARLALAGQSGAEDTERFWREVRRYGCTVIFYAGEMCRPLVQAPPQPGERENPVRLFAGSGMRRSVWAALIERYHVGVLEFYATSEINAVLANASGAKVGSVGRPLPGSASLRLVDYDFSAGVWRRDAHGKMLAPPIDQPGVLLVKLDPNSIIHDPTRVLHGVFDTGDQYWNTREVMRKDAEGDHFYLGRTDEILVGDGPKSGAILTSLRELEDRLERLQGVAQALISGTPNALRCLWVGGAHEDALRAALADLPASLQPATYHRIQAEEILTTEGFRPMRKATFAQHLQGETR